MIPFLKKLANVYISRERRDIDRYCFVFPNRRSGAFFKKYLLEEICGECLILPGITTISDFISNQSHLVDAGRVELLLILYQEYCNLADSAPEFDQFLYWGDMILNDFNDVDRFMVNAKELFTNVRNLKKIQSNFLTDEQKAVIKEYWGIDRGAEDSFWQKDSCKSVFSQLWNRLYDLYERFNEALLSRGLSYSGMNYRAVAEGMSEKNIVDFDFSRIIFVGFSTLSTAEKIIFNKFKNLGIGDYYWDFESPFFDEDNKGSFFLKDYIREFPSMYDIRQNKWQCPEIHVVSVPSGGGQAKIAGTLIAGMVETGKIADVNDAIDTAVVLPEEKYMNAVLYSVPDCIRSLNITMGLPAEQTPVASLIALLSALDRRKRNVDGRPAYFYEDVEALFAHPYIKSFCDTKIREMLQEAKKRRLFFVPLPFLAEFVPQLKFLFTNTEEIDCDIAVYVNIVLTEVSAVLNGGEFGKLESYYVSQYQSAILQLRNTINYYNIRMGSQSFFFLLSRVMSGTAIAFEGEPLRGLQIMGVLETRLLDFKNLIVLSMNEKIFPTKHYSRSFIPNSLRADYDMATYEYQDSMYTYYFYRMISRAENVYLLYDSRTQGLSSGEESRYIYQLDKIYNRHKNKHILYEYGIKTPESEGITVNKTIRIRTLLEKYRQGNSGKYLSASSINTYIDCPLRFYLNTVEGIREEQEMTDFIDSATFGQVVHSVLENLYNSLQSDNGTGKRIVTKDFLNRYVALNSIPLDSLVTSSINEFYNRILDKNRKLEGESVLIGKIVSYYIRNVLHHDLRLTPFEYIGSEVKRNARWNVSGMSVNFKLVIDRIDRVGGKLRIVDYKTGSDDISFKEDADFSALFRKCGTTSRKKAILQVLLYCNAYSDMDGVAEGIAPVIYKLKDVPTCMNGRFVISNNKKEISDFRSDADNEAFMSRIKNVLEEIFNPDVPFTQTKDADICTFCQFKEICGR